MERAEKLQFRLSGCMEEQTNVLERNNKSFNDLDFYRYLWNQDGCVSVKIASVRVHHNFFCHGIQTIYEISFADGRTTRHPGPENISSRGYYSYRGPNRGQETDTWIHLDGDDEYIQGLKIRQGYVVDRITVVTNRREVHCGGNGGVPWTMMAEIPSSVRVVAFAGLFNGVCSRIGFYAKPLTWERIGVYVCLRELVNQDRAVAKARPTKESAPGSIRNITTSTIVQGLISLDEGVFRNTMAFLTPMEVRWSDKHW